VGNTVKFDNRVFKKSFFENDADNSGTIDKNEMVGFINKLNVDLIKGNDQIDVVSQEVETNV